MLGVSGRATTIVLPWRAACPGPRQAICSACLRTLGPTTSLLAAQVITLLAAMAPTLAQAIEVACRNAYVILDGTPLRIDRLDMAVGREP